MADHEFTEDWERRMEEILILVGSLKIEESSSVEQKQKGDRGKKECRRLETQGTY